MVMKYIGKFSTFYISFDVTRVGGLSDYNLKHRCIMRC